MSLHVCICEGFNLQSTGGESLILHIKEVKLEPMEKTAATAFPMTLGVSLIHLSSRSNTSLMRVKVKKYSSNTHMYVAER